MIRGLRSYTYRRQARRQVHAISEGLRALAALRRIAEKEGNRHLAKLANALQYSFSIERDLCMLMTDVMTERNKWRRNLHARHLAILIVEFLDKIDTVLGKEFQSHINAVAARHPELITKYRDIRRNLARIGEQHRKQLRRIRNTAAAHRDADGDCQLEVINSVDELAILVVAQAISMWQWLILMFSRVMLQKLFAPQWKEARLSLYRREA